MWATFFAIVLTSVSAIMASVLGLVAAMTLRIREVRGAVSLKKIVMPLLGMATGSAKFLVPALAFSGSGHGPGAVALAHPLLLTWRLVREGNAVMMRRSNAFFGVTLVLAASRLLARGHLDTVLSVKQTAALFYLVAFGMILRWRVQMWVEYRRLTDAMSVATPCGPNPNRGFALQRSRKPKDSGASNSSEQHWDQPQVRDQPTATSGLRRDLR